MITDKVGTESQMIQKYSDRREVASSDEAELGEYIDSIPTDEVEEVQQPKTTEQIKKDGNDFVDNILETFPAVGQGIIKSTQELGNLAIDASNGINQYLTENNMEFLAGKTDRELMNFADDPSIVHQPDTFSGKMISGISQFLAPFAGMSKLTNGAKAVTGIAKFAKSGAIGAAVDFAAFDPHGDRLSNLVEHFPTLRNPVTEYLAANPKDTRAEGRFKNAIEGIGLGLVSEGFLKAVKVIRQQRVVKNTMKDTVDVQAKIEDVEIPSAKEGEAVPELPPEITEARAEVKKARPTQQPIEEALPEPPKEFVTTDFEADQVLKGFEDVKVDGKAANINLDKIQTVDDVKKVIKQVAKLDDTAIDEARRGTISESETSALADDLGLGVEELLSRNEGEAFNAETVIASRRILNASGDNIVRISKDIFSGNNSKVNKAKLVSAIDQHRVIQAQMSGIAAEAGRALRAFNFNVGMDTATTNRFLDDFIRLNGGDTGIEKLAEQLVGASTGQVSTLTRKSLGRKLVDAANEVFINGLLSGFKTHAVNAFSNFSVLASTVPERLIAEKSAQLRGATDSVARGEAGAMISGGMNAWTDAFKMAREAFKTGNSTFSQSTKIDLPFEKSITSKAFGLDEDTVLGKAVNFLGYGINIPTKLLESSDEFFKAVNYRMEVHAQAHRKAANEQLSKGLSDEETARIVKKLIDNPDETIQMAALDKARENTFTKPLGDVEIKGFDAKSIDDAIKRTPVMRVVAPFTKTNLNLVEYALNRTPLAKGLRADIRAGGVRRDQALGRVSFGMMTMGSIAGLTAQGIATGSGPADVKARRTLEASGWKPYSIKVGDTYIPYDKADPMGSVMGIAADIAEIAGHLSSDRDGELKELVVHGASAVMQFMTPEFLTKNIGDFFDVIQGDEKKFERFVSNVARGAIPYSSFLRAMKPALDNVKRDKRADPKAAFPPFEKILNEMRDTIPFMSKSLPPKRNIFGEAQVFNAFIDNPDDIGPVQTGKQDAISKEIQKLNMTGPDLINEDEQLEYLKIDMPERYFRVSGESYALSPQQYDRYVLLSSGSDELENNPFGTTLREALNEEVKNDYPSLGLGERTNAAKVLIIKNIISTYRKSAKFQLMQEDDEIIEGITQKAEERASKLTGEDVNLSL